MPQSFACLYYHLVFSTKDRLAVITPDYQQRLYDYIGGIIRAERGILLAANGTPDHIHLVTTIHKERSLTETLRVIKSRSSGWIHDTSPAQRHFAWQAGYGAFTINYKDLPDVKAYLSRQSEHHRTISFKEEFLAFLEENGVEYDERYIWD